MEMLGYIEIMLSHNTLRKGFAMNRSIIIIALLIAIATPAMAVQVGEKAPPLAIKKWVAGDATDPSKPDGKTITVVEFWATWCRPCLMTIPHLNKMHEKLKDKGVVIVGISGEAEAKVVPFAKKMKMAYRVAIDNNNATIKAYIGEKATIPFAFVVDKNGVVVWKGHPADKMDKVIAQVMDGTYKSTGPPKLTEHDIKIADAESKVRKSFELGDIDTAISGARELTKLDPKNYRRFGLLIQLLTQNRDKEGVREARRDAAKRFSDAPKNLNRLSWEILTEADLSLRDMELALNSAKRAAELTKRKDSATLDTLARAYYELGVIDKAIAIQKEAVAVAKSKAYKKQFTESIAYYENVKKLKAELSK
jgi:peroxiredoxin